jgi:hypothetical protein
MIHAKEVLDRLGSLSPIEFGDDVFRATRHGLAPLTDSTRGGRWSPRDVLGGTDSVATLYTSCVRDGALAELAFHYAQLTPFPSKPVLLHRLHVTTKKTLRLLQVDLVSLIHSDVDGGAIALSEFIEDAIMALNLVRFCAWKRR